MALNDIHENFQDYQEINKLRVFLYTPSNQLVRELETINPVLRLRKTGFHTFDFGLPAKIFNLGDLSHSDNPLIDYTLDGYEVEVWVGDTTQVGAYDKYRFIIANRPSSMAEEKPVFNYSCLSSEYELKKLPIINWPGIEVIAYKQTSSTYSSLTQSGTPLTSPPQLLDGTTGYAPIALTKTPKEGTITVTRAHTVYGVEEQLFPSTTTEPTDMNEDEYILYQSSGTWYIQAYVPGNIKLPVDNAGTIRWNNPVDQYKYYIYYETEDSVASGDITSSFEESPYFKKDGLTINEIVADLFSNLQSSDSNMQHFLGWTYDSVNSDAIEAIRSGLAFDNTNLYDILQSLAENYQVYIDYNTLTRVVKIRNLDFGSNNGLRFEYGKYLRGVTQEINTDNQINYVQGQDSNGAGFADVSWSGDNYLEDYTYFLDGVTHNGTSASGLPSRWLSNGLATELALRKYYQGIYNQEVWGNESGTVKGIAQLRYDLQEQIAEKQFELEEIIAKIEQTEGLIESYNNETDVDLKAKLDATSRETSYLVPKILAANTTTKSIGYSVTPTGAGGYTISDQTLTLSSSIYAKAFKLFGSPDTYFTYRELIDTVQLPVDKVYRSSIKVVFKNNGSVVTTKFMTFKQLNKELILDDIYLIDEIVVSGSLIVTGTYTTYTPISIDSIDVYQFASATPVEVASWTDFVERQLYLKELEEIKRNEKQLEIDLLQTGPQLLESSFDETAVINESNSYGLYELEQRLDYIRGFTAINYNNLTTAEKTELKRIRRGSVYQNTDIVDSKNLFEASRTYLEENVNPAVTVTIDTISILQAYEAQSDWSKVQIGEKVDIYVPQLQINIEAEIQEINIDFQNYKMGLTISTVQNYDKSFGKYFSNVFKLLTTNVYNEQRPNESAANDAAEFTTTYSEDLTQKVNGKPQKIGYDTNDEPEETNTSPNEINFNEVFVDPRVDRLVSRPPSWPNGSGGTFNLYGDIAPGTATLTSGGIYIKDEDDNLRVKLTARDGLVAEQFSIDLDGNASFSGTLAAGVDTTAIDSNYDASGSAAAALASANSYTDTEIGTVETTIATLQAQVDGAIDTYFGDGVPLPITTTSSGTTLPGSGSEGDTFYDTDDNLYYTFTQGSWVVGGNSDIDSITAWPTNDVDFYDAHTGDLYYDNTTGYAYRFTKTGTASPDVVGNYKWVQISDSAATAALSAASTAQATADGKITIFSASTDATYGTLVDDNILDGDVFMPTANFTATGATHTSLNNDYDFIQNDTYVYIASTKTFTKLQNVENKDTGSIAGWTIDATDIKAGNGTIALHSDSDNSGAAPYISIGQSSNIGYDNTGIFLGIDSSAAKLSLKSATNYLKWTGTDLLVNGDIGGSVNTITIGSAPGSGAGIQVSSTGIRGYNSSNSTTFNLNGSNGDASFNGEITSTSGTIAGWTINSTSLTRTGEGGLGTSRLEAGRLVVARGDGTYNNILEMRGDRLSFTSTGTADAQQILADEDLYIVPEGNLYLKAGGITGASGSKIYIEADGQPSETLYNPNGGSFTEGHTEYSTVIVKENIVDIDETKVSDFIDKLDIKEFTYKKDGSKGVSFIIEDEIEDDIPFKEALFLRQKDTMIFENFQEIPDFLKEYVNTPNFTKDEETGKYYFHPMVYNMGHMLGMALAVSKVQNKKIKDLEYKYDQLLATLTTVIAEVREIEDRLE